VPDIRVGGCFSAAADKAKLTFAGALGIDMNFG